VALLFLHLIVLVEVAFTELMMEGIVAMAHLVRHLATFAIQEALLHVVFLLQIHVLAQTPVIMQVQQMETVVEILSQ
jgi:hypothetical protein